MSSILVVAPARSMTGTVSTALFRRYLTEMTASDLVPPSIRYNYSTNAKLEMDIDFLELNKYDKVYFIGNDISTDTFELINERAKHWVLLNGSPALEEHLNLKPDTIERVGRCEIHNISEGVCSYIYHYFCGHTTPNEVICTVERRGNEQAWMYLDSFYRRADVSLWGKLIDDGFNDDFWKRVSDHNLVREALCDPNYMGVEAGIIEVGKKLFDVGMAAMSQRTMISTVARRISGLPVHKGIDELYEKIGIAYYFRNRKVHLTIHSVTTLSVIRFLQAMGIQYDSGVEQARAEICVEVDVFMRILQRIRPYHTFYGEAT